MPVLRFALEMLRAKEETGVVSQNMRLVSSGAKRASSNQVVAFPIVVFFKVPQNTTADPISAVFPTVTNSERVPVLPLCTHGP